MIRIDIPNRQMSDFQALILTAAGLLLVVWLGRDSIVWFLGLR